MDSIREVWSASFSKQVFRRTNLVDPRKPAGTHRRGSPEDLGYLMSLMIL
uniref:Uncharacterized protein n=1 Tax=Setaria viridis TaxID=4556 RepID=A0A4U6VLX9_SETVI|nr:hypothetical protein SEVIR_3G343232v2 [Setaria viridis]